MKLKIRLAAALAMGALVTMILPSLTASAAFSDVKTATSYRTAIEALQAKGVIQGYADGSFKPGASINRAEFLKIVLEARGDIDETANGCFPDVDDEWYAKYVCTAKKENIVAGYPNGMFKPEQNIAFVEAAKILANAYDLQIDANSPDWYEPFVRAIESSKGIPQSVAALDEKIDRGEMAEMMWRLSEGKSDQPSKGYLNVKYPELAVNMAVDTPQTAKSCVDLEAFNEEMNRQPMVMYYGEGDMVRNAVPAMANEESKSITGQSGAGNDADYSQTNVQVQGVDEADIVKTDGQTLFALRGSVVRIIRAVGSLQQLATIEFSNDGFSPTDMYLSDEKLVVIGNRWASWGGIRPMDTMNKMMIWPGPSQQQTQVRIYDVSDPSSPKSIRTLSFDGWAVTSRAMDGKMYLVLNQPTRWGGPIPLAEVKADSVLPQFEDSASGGTASAVVGCSDVVILPRVPSYQYLTVAAIPLSATGDVKNSVVLGNAENVYMSLQNLYVASTDWSYDWTKGGTSEERTRLYRFAVEDDGIAMKAQGWVPGHLLNQFSMDEDAQSFRVATTKNAQWNMNGKEETPSTNNVYVLNRNMETVGALEDLAPGEQIYSVRFMGDRGYVVTFRTIDPLFVIDLGDPRNPEVLGKLKIPGFSNYLHPYDETHLIGFGKDAVESKDGSFAWQQGMKIAIFDVSDVANPKQLHSTAIGERGTDSPLLYNHKALLFDKERGLLAFPVSVSKLTEEQKNMNDGSAYGSPVFQGAYVYNISLKDGFDLAGTITHYTENDMMKMGDSWYPYGKDIDRIVRIGDDLLTVSDAGVQRHGWPEVKLNAGLSFVEEDRPSSCPADDEAMYQSKDPDTCARIRFFCIEGKEAFSNECGCGCK